MQFQVIIGNFVSQDFEPTSFVENTMQRARSNAAARQNLPHLIFPVNSFPIDEYLLSNVKNSLYKITYNIECSILHHAEIYEKISEKSQSYPILMESGLMNDPLILDEILSLFRFQSLISNSNNGEHISDNWQNEANVTKFTGNIKECLQTLSLGLSRAKSFNLGNFYELSPENLYQLTWRILATFEIIDGTIDPKLMDATHQWLERYNEAETIAASSGKLIYLLRNNPELSAEAFWEYRQINAPLFIALLQHESSLERSIILNILADRSPLLCAMLFRAVDMDKKLALENLSIIFEKQEVMNSNILAQISDEYMSVEPKAALQNLRDYSDLMRLRGEYYG